MKDEPNRRYTYEQILDPKACKKEPTEHPDHGLDLLPFYPLCKTSEFEGAFPDLVDPDDPEDTLLKLWSLVRGAWGLSEKKRSLIKAKATPEAFRSAKIDHYASYHCHPIPMEVFLCFKQSDVLRRCLWKKLTRDRTNRNGSFSAEAFAKRDSDRDLFFRSEGSDVTHETFRVPFDFSQLKIVSVFLFSALKREAETFPSGYETLLLSPERRFEQDALKWSEPTAFERSLLDPYGHSFENEEQADDFLLGCIEADLRGVVFVMMNVNSGSLYAIERAFLFHYLQTESVFGREGFLLASALCIVSLHLKAFSPHREPIYKLLAQHPAILKKEIRETLPALEGSKPLLHKRFSRLMKV